MDWTQVITIIMSLGGALVAGIVYIHNDVKDIKNDMKQQSSRVDRLYEMFVDLLKSKNTP